jgi:hypothetical protein
MRTQLIYAASLFAAVAAPQDLRRNGTGNHGPVARERRGRQRSTQTHVLSVRKPALPARRPLKPFGGQRCRRCMECLSDSCALRLTSAKSTVAAVYQ